MARKLVEKSRRMKGPSTVYHCHRRGCVTLSRSILLGDIMTTQVHEGLSTKSNKSVAQALQQPREPLPHGFPWEKYVA